MGLTHTMGISQLTKLIHQVNHFTQK